MRKKDTVDQAAPPNTSSPEPQYCAVAMNKDTPLVLPSGECDREVLDSMISSWLCPGVLESTGTGVHSERCRNVVW